LVEKLLAWEDQTTLTVTVSVNGLVFVNDNAFGVIGRIVGLRTSDRHKPNSITVVLDETSFQDLASIAATGRQSPRRSDSDCLWDDQCDAERE
jgi:hypothetical protein